MNFNHGYEETLMTVFFVFFVVFALYCLGGLVLYIFRSIGLMTMASRRGMPNPWIIWIPLVGVYTIGAIADDIQAREGSRTVFRWLLLGGNILSFLISVVYTVVSWSSLVGIFEEYGPFSYGAGYEEGIGQFSMLMSLFGGPASLIGLAVYVITVIALYYVYKCYKPENSTVFTVLSVIFPFMQSILPFVLRNHQPRWLNPPSYYGAPPSAPGGYPPPSGFPGGEQQYGQQPPLEFGQQPPPEFGQPPYGGYPGEEPQAPYGDDPNRRE